MISQELKTFLEVEAPLIAEQVRSILTKELDDIKARLTDVGANSTRFGAASGSITASHVNGYIDEKLSEINTPQA